MHHLATQHTYNDYVGYRRLCLLLFISISYYQEQNDDLLLPWFYLADFMLINWLP